jgi:thiol-disulfide isomerase/thioredoxin
VNRKRPALSSEREEIVMKKVAIAWLCGLALAGAAGAAGATGATGPTGDAGAAASAPGAAGAAADASGASTAAAAPAAPQVERAREILEESARAYRRLPALREALVYSVEAPGAAAESKRFEYGFGPGPAAYAGDALFQVVALRGTMYLTKSDVADKYVAVPYDGDFGAALNRIGGREGPLFEPPAIAMHDGKSLEAVVEALRFKILEPLRIGACRSVPGPPGRTQDEILLTAANGELRLRLDADSHLLASLSLAVRPPGAPPGLLLRIEGSFVQRTPPGTAAEIAFSPGERVAVAGITDLESSRLKAGSAAPAFELHTLEGARVALRELRGRVVVLDFWATWCAPCWKTLAETQELFRWAAAEHLPVAVFAVDTLERAASEQERQARVAEFWRSQRFAMPTLLDLGDETFRSYGNPGLPSLVLVAPDGTVARYHQGLFPDMQETLRREVREALVPRPGG